MKVGVLGGGAWGTALAAHCARMGHDTRIWAREPDVVESINNPAVKENITFLKVPELDHFATSVLLPHDLSSTCKSYAEHASAER